MDRSNFIKAVTGFLTVGAVSVVAKETMEVKTQNEKPFEWGEKRWIEDGINYIEFTLPVFIAPVFRREDKNGGRIRVPCFDKRDVTGPIEEHIEACIGAALEYGEANYCTIIKVKGRPNLAGIVVTKTDLSLETDHYEQVRDNRTRTNCL